MPIAIQKQKITEILIIVLCGRSFGIIIAYKFACSVAKLSQKKAGRNLDKFIDKPAVRNRVV
uniref:Uncharacterized protein n=1 Tax=uncultured Desulfobacterium sp. TaxID=201089 RepID=E1YHU1_9BACT|nr:unknown protein [uncultured Desulfobacterium sp.]